PANAAPAKRGVVHCFSGSWEFAQQILALGFYLGFGGAVTFKNAKKPLETAARVPLERLLLETDAPYMTPEPFRGQRCDSSHIALTAAKIAEARGMDAQKLTDVCNANGRALFRIL
ncbi:MAG: TatD family hydrolase, partial [Oscillospiraceae bacterium]|nr:TatD family hydrolase [Oscillospiraceae bacterium]